LEHGSSQQATDRQIQDKAAEMVFFAVYLAPYSGEFG
jgi:hypothetical protein